MLRDVESVKMITGLLPRLILTPHRLSAIPYPVVRYGMNFSAAADEPSTRWQDYSCCMSRQLVGNRSDWVDVHRGGVKILRTFNGLHLALGNSDFEKNHFRPCRFSARLPRDVYCP